MLNSPIQDLAASLHAALLRDLPLVEERVRDKDAWDRLAKGEQAERMRRSRAGDRAALPMVSRQRRPYESEATVLMFDQSWPSSALGFPFHGKPERTEAYTVVVSVNGMHAVYFRGRHAYTVPENQESGRPRKDTAWLAYRDDLAQRALVDCVAAQKRYQTVRYQRAPKAG